MRAHTGFTQTLNLFMKDKRSVPGQTPRRELCVLTNICNGIFLCFIKHLSNDIEKLLSMKWPTSFGKRPSAEGHPVTAPTRQLWRHYSHHGPCECQSSKRIRSVPGQTPRRELCVLTNICNGILYASTYRFHANSEFVHER
jgi:hypothetical protein